MLIFGGFYEAARDTPRWYNDVLVLDLQTQQWLDMPHSKLTARPEPRSACNVDIINDDMIVHGGFSKLSKTNSSTDENAADAQASSETRVHSDSWVLHLSPILQGKSPTWERLTSSVQRKQLAATSSKTPNGRSGMAAVSYKNRLLVYGGVVDVEQHHHKMDSVFYNDLFAFDVEKRKWFPVHVKKNTGSLYRSYAGTGIEWRRRRKHGK
jgi:N-acetylneuraminic acid mutarotase